MMAIQNVCTIAKQAGEKIMAVYDSGELAVETKDDDSPLTRADLASHHHICDSLLAADANIPILSEESASIDFSERQSWERYWLIDPLDGTKEFIARRPEFTVNIALIDNGYPILGVIHVPSTGVTYSACKGHGAFRQEAEGELQAIQVRKVPYDGSQPKLTVVMSRHSGKGAVATLLEPLAPHYDKANIGSSLKMCLVAEGKADFYPRLGPTSEWDTAAAQIIVEEAGGALWDRQFKAMRYNTKASLLNDHFYVVGDTAFPWQQWCLFDKV